MSTNALPLYLNLNLRHDNSTSIYNIPESNIISCVIKEHVLSILPRIEIVLTDVGNLFELTPILDKDILILYFSNGVDDGLKAEFQLSNFTINVDPDANRFAKVKIAGHLNCKDALVTFKNRCFKNNSVEIFEKIAKEMGLNFKNKSKNPPSDLMKWIQFSNNYNFLKHVLKRSYIANDCTFLYGDVANNLNFNSLSTVLDNVVKFNTVFDRKLTENFVIGNNEDVLYFDSYDLSNVTDIYNDLGSYGVSYSDTTTKNIINKEIVKYNKKGTDYFNKATSYNSNVTNHFDFGMFNDLNLFENYNRAIIQNSYNRYNLFDVNIRMNINSSTPVKLFDKINFEMPSVIERSSINNCYSGHYLVTGITNKIISETPIIKEILISRCGINKRIESFNSIS